MNWRGCIWIAALIFVIFYLWLGSYPSRLLHGEIASATIIRRSVSNRQDVVVIQSKKELKEIENSLSWIWQPFLPVGSYEGYPRYEMQITYQDGNNEVLRFKRGEFTSGAFPPDKFMKLIENQFPPLQPSL